MTRPLTILAALLLTSQAHAQTTTERALLAACGPGATYLAPHVDRAARRHLTHAVLLVAVMRVESHCRPRARSHKHAIGLFQLLGVARAGVRGEALYDPATNIMLGAQWISRMAVWCQGKRAGLGAYGSGHCDRGRRYARKVLLTEARIWRSL
jgi:hypothetical protein